MRKYQSWGERTSIIPKHHFSRRAGHNTTDVILYLIKIVKDKWHKGNVVSLLSLDIKGAFPSMATD